MDVFNRLAPFIQDFIYENKWEELHGNQVAACQVIFDSDDNLLLSSGTASGKTEAAFLPVLTHLYEKPSRSVGAMYISPLKALINDQFKRLEQMLLDSNIPVTKWHGDASVDKKDRLIKHPEGILQITPESLESLITNKRGACLNMFCDLRFVIIDEVHSFMRDERGLQLLCVLERLRALTGVNPRRIGLSATLGDMSLAQDWLNTGTGRKCAAPVADEGKKRVRLHIERFVNVSDKRDLVERNGSMNIVDKDTGGDMGDREHYEYLFRQTLDKKTIIFANSREEIEFIMANLREIALKHKAPDVYRVHHGNVSALLRETTEDEMKSADEKIVTGATVTLELGIDIGRLERAFQIDAPWTVSSFLQRMGRTGRRELPPEMWFVMREDEPEARAMLPATIPWKLLQGIALVQLYLEERWVEPPRLDRLPFSLLYHQTMSTLASCGELSPGALADRVLRLHYFHRISQEDYRVLLRHLVETDHIQRTEQGGLIVGLAGERVVNSFKFYGVFEENEEYTVRSEAQELGPIVMPPPVGEKLAIAGHVWVVLDVDRKRHLVYCEQVKGNIPAYFGLCPGDLHTRILRRMRQVLREERQYPYLMKNAVARLEQARFTAVRSGTGEHPMIHLGGNMWCLLPWVGTYTFLTMERFLKIKCGERLGLQNLDSARPYYMQFTMKAEEKTFFRVITEEIQKPIDPLELVYPKELPLFNKYDEYLPEALVRKGFALGVLDLGGLRETILSWSAGQR